jgi:hypothetical protein
MSSPRYEAFKCRLEETVKTPAKISMNFSESLGPVVDFTRFVNEDATQVDTKALAGYMKEYFAESFKRRGDDMQDYEEQRETIVNPRVKDTDLTLSEIEYVYDAETKQNREKSKKLADYYSNIKTLVANTTLNEKQTTTTLKISSTVDVGIVDFHISLTGDNCLQIESTNLCNAQRSKRFNPKTDPQTLTITAANGSKAGISLLSVAMCQGPDCVQKNHRITLREGKPTIFTLETKSDTSIAGILTPMTAAAFDSAHNAVDRANDAYTISADVGSLLFEGGYSPDFTVNRFKNLKFYYRAPEGYAGPATIQLSSSTGEVLATKTQTITIAHPVVALNGKVIINGAGQQGLWNITLTNTDESHFLDANKIRQLNTEYMQKVEIQLRNPQNLPINVVDAKILVKAPEGLTNI